jgi:hypothetical protein
MLLEREHPFLSITIIDETFHTVNKDVKDFRKEVNDKLDQIDEN